MDLDATLWSELPSEMVEQVLSFVPVPDLYRYRSVCKIWNQLMCNPKFAALHAHNAGHQDASFIVMHYRRKDPYFGKITHGWCILDLPSRHWYTVKYDNDRHNIGSDGVVAMDGGLVCQYLKTELSPAKLNSIIVHDLIGNTAIKLPIAPSHCTSKSLPSLNMVVDSISKNFKIFLINHCISNARILRDPSTTMEERLKILNDPVIRVYNSATNEWQGSTNPSCVSSSGVSLVSNTSKVEYQGLLYVLLDSCDSNPLWTYNPVEDAWKNLPLYISLRLTWRELIVSANRLFLAGWFLKNRTRRCFNGRLNDSGVVWNFQVSEIKIPGMTQETLFELPKADVVALLDIKTEVENVNSEIVRISVVGFGNSLMLMSNSSGNSVAFDVVTRKWDREWPQNPVGRLSDEHCSWVGKHMNLLLPSALW